MSRFRFLPICLAQLICPVIALHTCNYDSDCSYAGCEGMQRCYSLGLCISAGSCAERNQTYCPKPSTSEAAVSANFIPDTLQDSSPESTAMLSPLSKNASMDNSSLLPQFSFQKPVKFASCPPLSQESSSLAPGSSGSIIVDDCHAVCYQPTTCTTCSGTPTNRTITSGSVNQIYFCCDLSNGFNIQMCRTKPGCPSTSPQASTSNAYLNANQGITGFYACSLEFSCFGPAELPEAHKLNASRTLKGRAAGTGPGSQDSSEVNSYLSTSSADTLQNIRSLRRYYVQIHDFGRLTPRFGRDFPSKFKTQ